MTYVFRVTALAVFVALFATVASADPYRIGVLLPLSGEAAGLGTHIRNGVELGYESLPTELKERVELIYEDDQLQSAKSVALFHKLRTGREMDAVIVAGSGVGHAVGPLAERYSKIMFAVGASDKEVVVGKKFVFTHWVSPEAESKVLVEELRRRGKQRIATVATEQQGAVAVEQALFAELKAGGIADRLVYSERSLPENRDFRTALARIRAKDADTVVLMLLSGGLSAFAKQFRDGQLKAELCGFETFEDRAEVAASDGALVGRWYANAESGDREFESRYFARYKQRPGIGAANGFDTIQLIARSLAQVGPDNQKIAQILNTTKDHRGVLGTYSATGDNRFEVPAVLKIVTAEGFEALALGN